VFHKGFCVDTGNNCDSYFESRITYVGIVLQFWNS